MFSVDVLMAYTLISETVALHSATTLPGLYIDIGVCGRLGVFIHITYQEVLTCM